MPALDPRGVGWTNLQCIIGPVFPTPARTPTPRMRKLLLIAVLAAATSGCGILYKQPIYQGNLIDKAAADQLKAGMSKQQVQALLGTPSVADPFHHDRWDYVASERTSRTGRVEIKDLTLWFEGDSLSKWEGDYFPEQDQALVQRMRKFGNLPKDKKKQH
jgi:outer membrane protein assembly factor BamE